MIHIFYTSFHKKLPDFEFLAYQQYLPAEINKKINRFHFWQDAHACLLGKLLLLKGMNYLGEHFRFENLSYNRWNRPFLENGLDFNISHSGEYVICAISEKGRVGIDIEKLNPVDILDFRGCWTDDEWLSINYSDNPMQQFYYCWTRKEAVVKAEGKGLNLQLDKINTFENQVKIDRQWWDLQTVNIAANYHCHFATNYFVKSPFPVKHINFYQRTEVI